MVRESLVNEMFADRSALQETLVRRCAWLADHPEIVKGAVGFRWAVTLG